MKYFGKGVKNCQKSLEVVHQMLDLLAGGWRLQLSSARVQVMYFRMLSLFTAPEDIAELSST